MGRLGLICLVGEVSVFVHHSIEVDLVYLYNVSLVGFDDGRYYTLVFCKSTPAKDLKEG